MIEKGDFREDLFYRLNVIGIKTPPLRERLEDIPLLAKILFRAKSARAEKKAFPRSVGRILQLRLAGQCQRAAKRN